MGRAQTSSALPTENCELANTLQKAKSANFLRLPKATAMAVAPLHCDGRSRGRYGGPLAASHRGAIAKTVAELSNQQDGRMRQQLIEHLMREIMNYDAEFRSEEATASSGSILRH